MKKAEAISILAASVRPREAKDRARYDEAVRMAIEALKCSETPKSSEQNAETAQADHIADTGKKAEQTAEIAQNVQNDDLIQRKTAIEALRKCQTYLFDERDPDKKIELRSAEWAIEDLPSAQPETCALSCSEIPNSSDSISRQTAIDALAKQMPRSYTPDGSHPADEEIYKIQEIYVDCIESIEILPAVQPEIVRCKDCKYMIDTGDDLMCDNAKGWVVSTTSDFGCVLAERRTE